MKYRRHLCIWLSAACLAALIWTPVGFAQQAVILGDSVTVEAEVVGIDKVDRILTLRGPEGNVASLEVSHAARNFDQIEIGDKVKAEYFESVAVYLGKAGEKPATSGGLVAARSAKGDEPAALAVETLDVSARVQAIDRSARTLTLELPDGSVTRKSVDPSVKAFDTLQEGDTIHARFTEAIAISVEK